jgi:hypothetical protein
MVKKHHKSWLQKETKEFRTHTHISRLNSWLTTAERGLMQPAWWITTNWKKRLRSSSRVLWILDSRLPSHIFQNRGLGCVYVGGGGVGGRRTCEFSVLIWCTGRVLPYDAATQGWPSCRTLKQLHLSLRQGDRIADLTARDCLVCLRAHASADVTLHCSY